MAEIDDQKQTLGDRTQQLTVLRPGLPPCIYNTLLDDVHFLVNVPHRVDGDDESSNRDNNLDNDGYRRCLMTWNAVGDARGG